MGGWCSSGSTYPRIQENEIHLHEAEDHLQQRINTDEDVVAWRIKGNLKEGAELQADINHGAQTKSYFKDNV